jgi:hypothetical protein
MSTCQASFQRATAPPHCVAVSPGASLSHYTIARAIGVKRGSASSPSSLWRMIAFARLAAKASKMVTHRAMTRFAKCPQVGIGSVAAHVRPQTRHHPREFVMLAGPLGIPSHSAADHFFRFGRSGTRLIRSSTAVSASHSSTATVLTDQPQLVLAARPPEPARSSGTASTMGGHRSCQLDTFSNAAAAPRTVSSAR